VPAPVAARSKVLMVLDSSNTGLVDTNPARGTDVCVRVFLCCSVLCRYNPCGGRSPVHFIVEETDTNFLRTVVMLVLEVFLRCSVPRRESLLASTADLRSMFDAQGLQTVCADL
jgi:hypothetical protein